MKRTIILSLSLVLTAIGLSAQPLRESKIIKESVQSAVLGGTVDYNVYLPAGYDVQGDTYYPVIYLLHGLYGTYKDWETTGHMKLVVDELIASGECRKVIIIMPNAGHPDVRNVLNGYFNVPGRNYEDFFFTEFIPAVERRYPIRADKKHRAIMGLSMGGGGSTVYAQRHPDRFSSCYSMSGWLDNPEPAADAPKDQLYLVQQSVHEHSAIRFVEEADDATLEQLRSVKWFFDCGDDDFLLELSVKLHLLMGSKGVKSELRVRDGWHSWEYWHTALRLSLPFASRNFAE